MFPIKTSKTSDEEFGKPLSEFKKKKLLHFILKYLQYISVVSYTDKIKQLFNLSFTILVVAYIDKKVVAN